MVNHVPQMYLMQAVVASEVENFVKSRRARSGVVQP